MDKRCPLGLKFTPEEECVLGENLFKQVKKPYCKCRIPEFKDENLLLCKHCDTIVVKCVWGINSKKCNYCFWRWFEDNEDKGISTERIGELLKLTVQRIGQINKKVLATLREIKIFDNCK